MSGEVLTGQCLCGAITCTATGEPVSTVNCHCSDCRRATGAVFSTVLYFQKERVQIIGVYSGFDHASDRGTNVSRMFCPTCGSQMFARASGWPDLIGIRAGCIKQTERIIPQRNVFVCGKIESTALDPVLPRIDGMPY
jgi:hypothetical protein